jgi:hypothetical protein
MPAIEFNSLLDLSNRLIHQAHGFGAVAAFVCGGLFKLALGKPQRVERRLVFLEKTL